MGKLLRSMPMKQFLEWKEYDLIDPIGGRRGDWQAAAICSTLANMLSRKKFNVSDFLLEFGKEQKKARAPQQSWREQKILAQMLSAAFNERPKKRKPNGR